MDTSKEYIEMCRKATEIQAKWEPKAGDWFVFLSSVLVCTSSGSQGLITDQNHVVYEENERDWLPHQDQLQDMLKDNMGLQPEFLAKYLYEFAVQKEAKLYDSMEQLWLAFVMHELYQKKWEGKEWTKQT